MLCSEQTGTNLYTKESCVAICPQTNTFRGISVARSEPSTYCWCWYDDGTVPQEGVDRPAGFSAVTENSGSGPIVMVQPLSSTTCYKFRPNS